MNRTAGIFATLFVSLGSCVAFASPSSSSQQVVTADGQSMSCMQRSDLGRMGYRVTSSAGVINAGNVEITIQYQTLKCSVQSGVFGFEPAGLAGKLTNSLGGFVEFSTLELVAYTPDLKVMKSQPASLIVGEHTASFTVPVANIAGLLSRNVNGVGDRRVNITALLRGQASLGEAKSGRVQERALVAFGTYSVILSESARTLTFAQDVRALTVR